MRLRSPRPAIAFRTAHEMNFLSTFVRMVEAPVDKHKWDLPSVIALCIGIALVTLNVLRIFHVSITHDETASYATNTYLEVMVNEFASANNHILHSLLRKFFTEIFNDGLFFLRLDSLLAQVVFLFVSYRSSALMTHNRWQRLLSFATISTASPLIFEFWGLSRGYAVAVMCLCISVHYLLRYLRYQHTRSLVCCLIAAILAVYSNFSLINYFVALLLAVMVCRLLLFERNGMGKAFLRELLVLLAAAIVLAALITVPLGHAVGKGELQFLGHTGLIADTFYSLAIDGVLMLNCAGDAAIRADILVYAAIVIAILSGIYWSVILVMDKVRKNAVGTATKYGMALFLLLVIPAVAVKAQYEWFGINYIKDRAGLFLIFLFVLCLVHLVTGICRASPAIGTLLLSIIAAASVYNFCTNASLNSTRIWWYSNSDIPATERILREHGSSSKKIKLWVEWSHIPSFKYNTEHLYKGRFETIPEEYPAIGEDTTFDYCYVYSWEGIKLPPCYLLVDRYAGGGMQLFKKK